MNQLPPGIRIGGHINDNHPPVTLWLFHPLTGKMADDMSVELAAMSISERRRSEKHIKQTKRNGGRFYWRCDNGEWGRVELVNFSFAAMACGQQVILEHNFPAGTDRLEWLRKLARAVQ